MLFAEGIRQFDGKRKRTGYRIAAMCLHRKIIRHTEQPNHIAHGASADFMDTAVMGAVFAAVRIGKHGMRYHRENKMRIRSIWSVCEAKKGYKLATKGVEVIVNHFPRRTNHDTCRYNARLRQIQR